MRVVLDTNVILISISSKSVYRPIFDGILQQKYEIAVSNEIISEYVEILETKTNHVVASNIAELLLNLKNVIRTDIYFNWNLIEGDKEDNKFVDCAVAANVKFVVTNDKHFNILNQIDFPKIEIIGIGEFLKEVESIP